MMHFERQLKFSFHYLLFTVIASVFIQCMAQNKMETEFKNPPSSVQTGTYWYWIEGNISREGVIKDLEAMKAAGINRAFIANIGGAGTGDPNASRKVEFMSEEWWDITHAALKKATELDIEIGIFNSPGWSQSGGPWIKPEETMRYLASSQKILKGPEKVSVQLPQPTEHFEDVKVLAFPNPTPEGTVLDMANADITITPHTENVANLVDGDNHTGMSFHGEGGASIDIKAKQPFTARSIVIRPTSVPICTDVELQAKSNDGTYKTVSHFQINRLRDWKKVGFDPYADVAITFEPTTSNEFRVIFSSTGKGTGLSELTISSVPRVERFKEKSLAKLFQTEVPAWSEYLWREQPEKDERKYTLNPGQVIDISDKLSADGLLNWEVPEGEWMVIRTGMAPTGVVPTQQVMK